MYARMYGYLFCTHTGHRSPLVLIPGTGVRCTYIRMLTATDNVPLSVAVRSFVRSYNFSKIVVNVHVHDDIYIYLDIYIYIYTYML